MLPVVPFAAEEFGLGDVREVGSYGSSHCDRVLDDHSEEVRSVVGGNGAVPAGTWIEPASTADRVG